MSYQLLPNTIHGFTKRDRWSGLDICKKVKSRKELEMTYDTIDGILGDDVKRTDSLYVAGRYGYTNYIKKTPKVYYNGPDYYLSEMPTK